MRDKNKSSLRGAKLHTRAEIDVKVVQTCETTHRQTKLNLVIFLQTFRQMTSCLLAFCLRRFHLLSFRLLTSFRIVYHDTSKYNIYLHIIHFHATPPHPHPTPHTHTPPPHPTPHTWQVTLGMMSVDEMIVEKMSAMKLLWGKWHATIQVSY